MLAEVSTQPFFTEGIEVLDVSDMHVPRHPGEDGERESRRMQIRVLAPPDIRPAVVQLQGQSLDKRDLVEGGSRVDEGDKQPKSSLQRT